MAGLPAQVKTALKVATYQPSDARTVQIVHHLCAVYPGAFTARKLMGFSGFASHRDPVTPFVEFINMINRINASLAPHGFSVWRTGGTPDDRYGLVYVME